MQKLDLSKYKVTVTANLPAHRFQELVLNAIKEFDVDPKGKGMVWGRIGLCKKAGRSSEYIEQKLQYVINETRELSPKSRGRYFVKLIFKYL